MPNTTICPKCEQHYDEISEEEAFSPFRQCYTCSRIEQEREDFEESLAQIDRLADVADLPEQKGLSNDSLDLAEFHAHIDGVCPHDKTGEEKADVIQSHNRSAEGT